MKLFYSDAYVRAGYEFDTLRKSLWIVESLGDDPIPGVQVVAPTPATALDLASVHDAGYVEAVRSGVPCSLAQSQGFDWDSGLWDSVCASTGGVVAATRAALDDGVAGSLSSGLHHAKRNRGEGFCTFNGIALAAQSVIAATTIDVLIVDLDAHCGGGTASLIANSPRITQIDVAVNGYDAYDASGTSTLRIVRSADQYLSTVENALESSGSLSGVGLVLYNAGMDPYEGCDVGGLRGITEQMLSAREHLVFDWASSHGVPIAFVIAGGYEGAHMTRETLVGLHRATLNAALATPAARI